MPEIQMPGFKAITASEMVDNFRTGLLAQPWIEKLWDGEIVEADVPEDLREWVVDVVSKAREEQRIADAIRTTPLLPCPVCGGESSSWDACVPMEMGGSTPQYETGCRSCGLHARSYSKLGAIETWNQIPRRAKDAP